MPVDQIPLEELRRLLTGRPGLVVGPAASLYPGALDEAIKAIGAEFPSVPEQRAQDLFHLGDAAQLSGPDASALRGSLAAQIGSLPSGPSLGAIAEIPWAAVLSLSIDMRVERLLADAANASPTAKPVTVLYEPDRIPPPDSLPVFKLLGSTVRLDFPISSPELRRQTAKWAGAVRYFGDRTRGAPVLCLGVNDSIDYFYDLLGFLSSERRHVPSALVFLKDDPITSAPDLAFNTPSNSRLFSVSGTLGLVAKEVRSGVQQAQQSKATPAKLAQAGVVVNDQLAYDTSFNDRERLLDLLFSPDIPNWEPYSCALDFPRTAGTDLRAHIEDLYTQGRTSGAIVITGSSATGKTTILKRTAYDLASDGELVLWLSPTSYGDIRAGLDAFFALAAAAPVDRRRAVVVIDDPTRHPVVSSASEVRDIAATQGVSAFVLLAIRTVDWISAPGGSNPFVGDADLLLQLEVQDTLDDAEWRSLPTYLHRIGAAATLSAAVEIVARAEARYTRDTLSLLYWLLPQTRNAITSSVRDEYIRLGDNASLTALLMGQLSTTTELLRHAYELVAVADKYNVPVPIEVLVSALETSYQNWINATPRRGAMWGLLYAVEYAEGDTITYRTRSSVVTDIIVKYVNGGLFGHSGELRVLRRLVGACTGTHPAHREFLLGLLARNPEFEKLDYGEGLELFELAEKSLPLPDKTLVHQKGKWIRTRGRDPAHATRVLEEALRTPVYPYARRGESDEFIYTSLAASVIDGIDTKTLSREDGRQKALDYLSRARSKTFFNAHAVHVQAELMVRLASTPGAPNSGETLDLIAQAVTDLDRTILVLSARGKAEAGTVLEQVRMLEAARDKVWTRFSDEKSLEEQAQAEWEESASQHGFILRAEQLFWLARSDDRGRRYRDTLGYLDRIMKLILESGRVPDVRLYQVATHALYTWRVHQSGGVGAVDWDRVAMLASEAAKGSGHRGTVFYTYVHALAQAHRSEWTDSDAVFHQHRQIGLPASVLWKNRDFLLDANGNPLQVQGDIRVGSQRKYLSVEELQRDFRVDFGTRWPEQGNIAHAYIAFSFGGPLAVRRLEKFGRRR
ncbi:MAG: hypothetical protein KC619_11400 [Myxococcales bacterium]|nr:hypothetical protein [Myxococcales bacterium]